MQQYRVAAAVHGGGDIKAIRNGSGAVEVFTVGTDGTIWNFYPDSTSDTGYSSISTGMVGNSVTAGVDGNGHIVLFAGNNLALNYVKETAGAQRWGPVQTAQLPLPVSPTAVAQIYAGTIGGTLYVGALTRMKSAFPGNTYAFAYSIWDQNLGVFTFTPMTLSSLNCVWSGSSAATAEFTCLDQTYLGFEVATATVTHYSTAASFHSLAVATVLSGSQNQYFAVLNDGNLYSLIGGGQSAFSWAQITQGKSFQDVAAAIDSSGAVQLFALGSDARLYHVTTDATGRWTDPMVIETGAALMGIALDDGGDIEMFLVGTAQATLTRLIQTEDTGDWQASQIEVPTSGQVEEFIAYSTDITVTDAAGAPLSGAGIQVWASGQTQISVNGATYVVDPTTHATLTANAAGRLSITQPTSSLGIPTLEISVTGQSQPGQSTGLHQAAGVQARLAAVDSGELMTATDASGAFILQDQYRNQATTTALAQSFNACMKLTDAPAVQLDHASLPARARKLGVGRCPRGSAAYLGRIGAPAGFQPWQIDFSGKTPVFRLLSPEEAHTLLVAKRALHLDAAGFLDFIGSIGDIVGGIVDGVVDVIDTVVTAVGNAVNAAITFVVDGVTYVFNTVVNFIEQAFDLVESIFAKVKVFFEKVFEWLGFLFGWGDILRTHNAIVYTVNQYLGFVQGATAGIQSYFDSGIATIQNEVDTIFDQLINMVGANNSVGGYVNKNTPSDPGYNSAASNNIVYNGTLDNLHGSTSVSALIAGTAGDDPLGPLISQLQQLVQTVEALPQWQQALDYMNNLGGSVDQIFQQLLSALLRIVQGIIKAIIAGLKAVVDALLQLVGQLIAQIQAMLNEEWDIPFVSALYSWVTDGSDLTTLDLLALILAIPGTIAFKALYSKAPFPDNASVDSFKASFTAQTMLANSGFGPPAPAASRAVAAPQTADVSGTALGVGIPGLFAVWAFGGLSAILDFQQVTGVGEVTPWVKKLTKIALACEIVGQALGTPWITSSSGGPNCDNQDGANKVAFIYETLGVGLDIAFFVKDEAFAENNDTNQGVWIAFLYAVGHTITVGVVGKHMSGWGLASKITLLIPELCKLLRLTSVVAASEDLSLVAMATLDGLGYAVSGICGFVDAITPPPSPPGPPPPSATRALAPPPPRLMFIPGAVPNR